MLSQADMSDILIIDWGYFRRLNRCNKKGVLSMQLALHNEAGVGSAFFADKSDRDYLVRSEQRPNKRSGDGNGKPPRRRKGRRRKKLDIPYVLFTFVLLTLLYPVGLAFLWMRRRAYF